MGQRKLNMAGTQRLKEKILEYLEANGSGTTTAIYEHCNRTLRHGTTKNQLGNVLSKSLHNQVVKVDFVDDFDLEERRRECVWALRTEHDPNYTWTV